MPPFTNSEKAKDSNGAEGPKKIGEVLRQARQKKGLTIEKVHKITRIQSKIIEALEQGRADEVLSRVYVLLFVRKYASFLELDSGSLAAEYKAFYNDKGEQIRDIVKEPLAIDIDAQKWWVMLASFVAIIFIFAFFILILGVRLKSSYSTRKTIETASLAGDSKAVPEQVVEDKTRTIFPIPKNKPIELTLLSTGEVWMKVKKDEKVTFEGTLHKNERKTFSAENDIELWAGRVEALDFTINERPIGKIGTGTIKNIHISRLGLKTGNKWLIKAKE